jgi:hypothetical protein
MFIWACTTTLEVAAAPLSTSVLCVHTKKLSGFESKRERNKHVTVPCWAVIYGGASKLFKATVKSLRVDSRLNSYLSLACSFKLLLVVTAVHP